MSEHVTGEAWPDKATRQQRLEESVQIIRELHDGKEVTRDGLITVQQARIWDAPAIKPPLIAPSVHISADPDRHAQWFADYADLGLEELYLHFVGQEQTPVLRIVFRSGRAATAAGQHWAPDRDDGYDVTDMYGVDGRLGTLGDVVEFILTAKDRGMRVIADFVVNHTSDRHPWFVESRKSPDNPYRDYSVRRDDTPPNISDEVVFPAEESSIWTRDTATGE